MKATLIALALVLGTAPGFAATAPAAATAAAHSDGVRLVVPTRNIARGEVIGAGDLEYTSVETTRAFGGTALSVDQLEGKEARRFLQVGQPVRTSDVRAPILVTKGSTVTMTFEAPGISLTATGKAMSEGGLGETVTVLNPVSYRQISATVTGPGAVTAGSTTSTITASAQLAANTR